MTGQDRTRMHDHYCHHRVEQGARLRDRYQRGRIRELATRQGSPLLREAVKPRVKFTTAPSFPGRNIDVQVAGPLDASRVATSGAGTGTSSWKLLTPGMGTVRRRTRNEVTGSTVRSLASSSSRLSPRAGQSGWRRL